MSEPAASRIPRQCPCCLYVWVTSASRQRFRLTHHPGHRTSWIPMSCPPCLANNASIDRRYGKMGQPYDPKKDTRKPVPLYMHRRPIDKG